MVNPRNIINYNNYEDSQKKLIQTMEQNNNKDWKKIHVGFTPELQAEWESKGFSYEECKEWIDADLKTDDSNYARWLRDTKKKNAEWILNYGNSEQLEQEYSNSHLSVKIIKEIEIFYYWLTLEQKSSIEQLIPNPELRERYLKNGLCKECRQPKISYNWCQPCSAQHFRENFKNWTSGNKEIDKFIQRYQLEAISKHGVLEWISYKRLKNVEYLAKGGFGKVYKAEWIDSDISHWGEENKKWMRGGYFRQVALKSLNNSQNVTTDFLREITCHKLFGLFYDDNIVSCYGISQDPLTRNYLMVMEYIDGGSLRKYLDNDYDKLDIGYKLSQLLTIAKALNSIHDKNLIHQDLHSGNILKDNYYSYITDLGLSRPVDEQDKGKIYGVLPYIAPEVLRGQPYTPVADIYSFGIIAYEILTGLPPYYNAPHNEFLGLKICEGLRPKFNIKLPQLLYDLIKQCWDADLGKRPTADEIHKVLKNWCGEITRKESTEFYRQYQEKEWYLNNITPLDYKIHPQAFYTSRLLDFSNLPQPQNSQETNDEFYNNNPIEEVGSKEPSGLTELLPQLDIKNNYLANNSTGLTKQFKRQCSLSSETQDKTKSTKLDQPSELVVEPEFMELDQSPNWQNINSAFTDKLRRNWENNNFIYDQTKEWIDVGMRPTGYDFCAWLRDVKKVDSKWVIDYGDQQRLSQEFFQWWQENQLQANIEITPAGNN